MKFRFRKTKKILPGVKVTITDKGISTNIGTKRANVGIGKRGVHGNVSIPGTGVSGRQKLSGNSKPVITGLLIAGAFMVVVLVILVIAILITVRFR